MVRVHGVKCIFQPKWSYEEITFQLLLASFPTLPHAEQVIPWQHTEELLLMSVTEHVGEAVETREAAQTALVKLGGR